MLLDFYHLIQSTFLFFLKNELSKKKLDLSDEWIIKKIDDIIESINLNFKIINLMKLQNVSTNLFGLIIVIGI